MIKPKTKILIKDNSGLLEANCINCGAKSPRTGARVGHCVKASVSKLRLSSSSQSGLLASREGNARQSLQNVLIVQTKAPIFRGDGSTIQFNSNSGVSILLKKAGSKKQHQLGFKRINTAVSYELNNKTYAQELKVVSSVIKLARQLL